MCEYEYEDEDEDEVDVDASDAVMAAAVFAADLQCEVEAVRSESEGSK